MGNFQERENGSTIVGDGDISDIVNKHLVKTEAKSERTRDDQSGDFTTYPTGPKDDLRMLETV